MYVDLTSKIEIKIVFLWPWHQFGCRIVRPEGERSPSCFPQSWKMSKESIFQEEFSVAFINPNFIDGTQLLEWKFLIPWCYFFVPLVTADKWQVNNKIMLSSTDCNFQISFFYTPLLVFNTNSI